LTKIEHFSKVSKIYRQTISPDRYHRNGHLPGKGDGRIGDLSSFRLFGVVWQIDTIGNQGRGLSQTLESIPDHRRDPDKMVVIGQAENQFFNLPLAGGRRSIVIEDKTNPARWDGKMLSD